MGAQQPSVRQIGKYIVLDVIGAGGMGIVYRAQDPAIGRTVAIKMLRPREGVGPQGGFDRFFLRELKSTGNLHHKNIVTVYDNGEQDGVPYLVMEYLEGEPVSRIISDRKPLSLLDKIDLIVQICDGLQYAHDRNIVHRDIKPANVILLADGTAKLVDFGVARIAGSDTSLVQTGLIVGSLSYMSPEQINSLPIDGRSDIFSTGVMFYELLTYEVPFKGTDPSSTFVRILREEPVPLSRFIPDAPPALQAVMNRALAKNAHDRYQSAEEFGFDLLGIQNDLKVATVADSLKRAESAMQRGDLERVRSLLQDVLRLDRHNERANRLLREVRQTIQQQQRSSQVGQIRSQAQVALAGGQYEEALACADQALRLDPTDTETIQLCDQIRNAISRAKAVREALNRAETALFAGDFDEAKDAVEESLRLDPTDSGARALAAMINKELAERSRRHQVQGFVDQARRGIAERKFTDAIDALHRAEELDPTDSNVRELLQWAQRGQEQENKRRYLQDITNQIENALHGGDFSSACTISEMGLQRFPEDPTLLRLRAISEKQRDIGERRRFVHDQSLAVKALTDEDKLLDAVQVLTEALRRYPGEPNLESLLAITKAAIERQQIEREEAARKRAMQRAEAEARSQLTQQVLNWSIELRRALDARAALADILKTSKELRLVLDTRQIEDHARDAASLVLNELNARIRARDQAMIDLEQLQRAFERSLDSPALNEAESRMLSAKAAFPNESSIQRICSDLTDSISKAREERNRSISLLGELAQTAEAKPTRELMSLQEKARNLAAGVASDPRAGALLQQIDSSINRRFARRAELLRDIAVLHAGLSKVQSLDEIDRIRERGRATAALDSTDDELAERSRKLQGEAQALRDSMESLLRDMAALARRVASATTIDDAEGLVPQVKELADRRPDFQTLQEAATHIFAEVQGRRIEHDLIVQELEAALAALPLVETDEELDASATRARECLELHSRDATIQTLSRQIVDHVETILQNRAELRARHVECDNALQISRERLDDRDLDGALDVLLSVEEQNPDRVDLHVQISILRKAIEQRRAEQEQLEQEQRAREQAEAEARARRAAIEQAIQEARELLDQGLNDESVQRLRSALEREPGHDGLEAALQFTQAEISRRREEHERLERERIAREQAEAEARARREAAELAIIEARELLAQSRGDESLQRLRLALQHDSQNPELQKALDSTQAEIARQRAEQERLERERLERERAEAQERARKAAADQAVEEAWNLLAQGQGEASVQTLRSALERDPANTELYFELQMVQEELGRRRAEQERVERERIAREKAEAEARARREAAGLAIKEARELLAQGRWDESVEKLRLGLQQDPQSAELRKALDSTEAEVARQRAEQERLEQERLERERLERERVEREKAEAEARARREAAKLAIKEARELLAQGRNDESVEKLRLALQQDPQSPELRKALDSTEAEIARQRAEQERLEQERLEHERLERERVEREKAEAEARARREAAKLAIKEARELLAQGRNNESVEKLRRALQQDPQSAELRKALDSTEAEIARQRAEQERLEQERLERERLERERVEREKAEAEARARREAAKLAIKEARELLAQGRNDESVEKLRLALQQDPQSPELRKALDSTEAEIARQRAEQERIERERARQEQIERERAEAEARARRVAAAQAIDRARKLFGKGKSEESLECLRDAIQRDPQNAELTSEVQSLEAELARQLAEQLRLEQERAERERLERERAEAEARLRTEKVQQAIREARELQASGRMEESIQRVRSGLELYPKDAELSSELESIQKEIDRQRAEKERLERERLERERVAREKAEAEARARRAAADRAIKDARRQLAQGNEEASLLCLQTALERDPENSNLLSELQWFREEITRRSEDRERLERERLERERIAREKAEAEARARREAAELAIKEAGDLLAQGRNDESVRRLRLALQQDPQNPELRKALDSTQAEVARQRAEQERLEQERLERERLERERIAREKAEAEARARREAAELAIKEAGDLLTKGRNEESVQRLREALQQDSQNPELRKALDSTQAEVARQRAEQERLERERQERERLERERIAREKAEAEARARREAAELAIKEARDLLAKGRNEESVQMLRLALQQDRQNPDLRKALDSTQAEIARQRAERERLEQERLERERLERERIAREKAEAEARARKKAAEQAIKEAQELHAQGRTEESVQHLASAAERDPASAELKAALQSMRAEAARQHAEKERLEREQRERERIAREKAEAEERARLAAAEQAIQKARKLLAKGSGEESLQCLRSALERDPKNKELRSALESTQAEVDRQRAERERLERERAAKEQAALRARNSEIEQALQQARKLQSDGKAEEALQHLRAASKRYSDSQELRSALQSAQAEIARQRSSALRPKTPRDAQPEDKRQANGDAATKFMPATAGALAGEREASRRRLIVIGIVAGVILALATGAVLVSRTIWAPKTQITFTLNPPDSTLKIDGSPTACAGTCVLSLSSKDHRVVLEKSGYKPAEIVVGPHSDKALTLRLDPLSVVPAESSSLSIATDAAISAAVSLDGKPVGDLSMQRLELSNLATGSHNIVIPQNDGTLEMTVEVSPQGAVQVNDVRGLDQNPVVAMTQNGERQEIFCRCEGAEIHIDGKKAKRAGANRYAVPGKGASEHEVTLLRNGQAERIRLVATDAKYGMVFIASSGQPFANPPPASPDEQAWEALKSSRDLNALKSFQAQYPQSPFARLAYQRSADLSWETIRNSSQASAFQGYLSSYADSPHAQEARDRIATLTPKPPPPPSGGNQPPSAPPDLAAWNSIKNTHDINVLKNFRAQYPNSSYAEQAFLQMAEIEWSRIRESQKQADFEAFLKEYPGTPHASEAQSALASLQKKAQDELAVNEAKKGQEQVRRDRESILLTLDAYKSAYERKDFTGLATIWPNVPRSFKQQFSATDKIHLTLTPQQEPQISGETATVPCTQKLELVVSGKKTQFEQTRLFTLRRVQDRWIIEKDN